MLRPAAFVLAAALLAVTGAACPSAASPITAYGINFVPDNLSTYAHRFDPEAGRKANKRLTKRTRKEDKRTPYAEGLKTHQPENLNKQ